VAASSAALPEVVARARVQQAVVVQARARPAVEAAAGARQAEVVAVPGAVAAEVVAAPAVVAAGVAGAAVAFVAESAARYSAATAEQTVPLVALRHPYLVDAGRDVLRAVPAGRQAVARLAQPWTAQLSVLSWRAAAPSANQNPVKVVAAARLTLAAAMEAAMAAALARAQPTESARHLVRRAADASLIGRAHFFRVAAEQSPQRLAE
jgi:hypothetical protein